MWFGPKEWIINNPAGNIIKFTMKTCLGYILESYDITIIVYCTDNNNRVKYYKRQQTDRQTNR